MVQALLRRLAIGWGCLHAAFAAASPAIEWEVEEPFPLLQRPAFERIRSIYDRLPESSQSMHALHLALIDHAQAVDGGPLLANPADARDRDGSLVLRRGSLVPINASLPGATAAATCEWAVNGSATIRQPCSNIVRLLAPIDEDFIISHSRAWRRWIDAGRRGPAMRLSDSNAGRTARLDRRQ